MFLKHWIRPQPPTELAGILAKEYNIPLFLAEILQARGIDSPAKAESILGESEKLSDPFVLPDMEKAVQRIKSALSTGEKIAVYGDYDCDGICASVILMRYFESLGVNAHLYIPSRTKDGYGLNCDAIDELKAKGINLIITVDNGISALKEAEYAKKLGIDLVITDHHQPGETLPSAAAVVNPHRKEIDLPYRFYCGAGIALQLVLALCSEVGIDESLKNEFLALSAVATVGDVVPLTGENRFLVAKGLETLQNSGNTGLEVLLDLSGVKTVTARSVAFGVVPRINAAGRMGNAMIAAELLLCKDREKARQQAMLLNDLNTKRQKVEREIFEQALDLLEYNPALLRQRVLVLSKEGWDTGVIGIVSARLLERFGKPVFLFSIEGEFAIGSARSVEEFSVFRALQACGALLERYGGHAQAGGLTIRKERLCFFVNAVNEYAERFDKMPRQVCRIDRLLNPRDVTLKNAESLRTLEPYGAQNPEPVFLMDGMKIEGVVPLSGGKHTKVILNSGGNKTDALCFGRETTGFPYPTGSMVDVLVNLEVNEFAGRRLPSLRIKELRPAGIDESEFTSQQILADKICCGQIVPLKERENNCLSREQMIPVYRLLKKYSGYRGDLAVLYFNVFRHKISYVQFCAALAVLRELKLIDFSEVRNVISVTDHPVSVSLETSKLFCSLQKQETDIGN